MLSGSLVATHGGTHGTFGWIGTDLRAEGFLVTRSRRSEGRFPFCIVYKDREMCEMGRQLLRTPHRYKTTV